ncbi:LysR family transcriptional regulator [Roseibium sp. SCPC15]|uniref:LysR family transcriptional regulator n=1 Tax=Roseibium sp. SCP15 TaxID=3141376 RepID=UPI0033376FFE
MNRITVRQCEYFQAIAKNGGITAAAKSIGISQPAIAQAITKLEETTGLILFVRHHARGMELTPQGVEFLKYADELVACATRASEIAGQIASNRAGKIKLGCFQSIAPFFLAQLVCGYRKEEPGVTLEVSELLHSELETAIHRKDVDLAVMYDLGLDPAKIAWQELAAVKPYLIVPQSHRLAEKKVASIKELESEDYILFDAPGSRDYFFRIFAHYGIGPKVAFRSTSIESVRCSVAKGLGVSILAMRPASNQTYGGNSVVPIEILEDLPETPIIMAYRRDREMDDLSEKFIEFCKEVFAHGVNGMHV